MAKNSQIYSANNPYGNRDEEIRKAKGNPNKTSTQRRRIPTTAAITAPRRRPTRPPRRSRR